MKRFGITIIILLIGIALISCGEGKTEGEMSEVTIYISDSQTARIDVGRPTLLVYARRFIKNLIEVKEASAIPTGITDVRYSVSGSGMSAISGVTVVSNDAVKIVLYIPNGSQRHFVLDARYANTCVRYRGATDVDLNGRPITLNVSMNLVSADLCPSNASVGYDITYNINNSGNSTVANGAFYYVQYQSGSNNLCRSGTSAAIPADSSVTAGAYSVGADPSNYRIIVDPNNSISETDESNNQICGGTFCSNPPAIPIDC